MSRGPFSPAVPSEDNALRILGILAAGMVLVHAGLAARGDLRAEIPAFLAIDAVLLGGTGLAWWVARRAGPRATVVVLAGALAMRLAAAWGGPALSDDLYRYVWDGRVQAAGIHPYLHAPDDPALAGLRDDDWARINHPGIPTVYPPLAEAAFLALAALGLGPAGFQAAMGLADFGVVLLLLRLLRARGLPEHRLVAYAWHPLAILETAGSGHLEPLGVALVLAAVLALERGRAARAAAALGLAIQVKLFPVVLVPGFARRLRVAALAALAAAALLPALPYAVTGPALGGGVRAYAERWERNASAYAAVEALAERADTPARLGPWIDRARRSLGEDALPWDALYRSVWPREVAKATVAALALAWVAWLAFRPALDLPRETLWALGGVLLLSPTVHPWYLLWIAPLAALAASPGWLAWVALVPLAYLGGAGDVPAMVRAVEYVPVAALLAREAVRELAAGPPRAGDGRRIRGG